MSGEPWRVRCGLGVSGIRRHRGGKGKSRQDYEVPLKSLFQRQWGTINILNTLLKVYKIFHDMNIFINIWVVSTLVIL